MRSEPARRALRTSGSPASLAGTRARDTALAASCGLVCLLAQGCRVGPKYVVPNVPAPPAYKEGPPAYKEGSTAWKQATPLDTLPRGAWWTVFHDEQLNGLEPQVETANQTLRAADANLRAARAEISVRSADRFPTVGVAPYSGTQRYSTTQPYFNPGQAISYSTNLQFPLQAAYEPDLWGSIHRNIEAGRDEAQANFADRVNALLSLQAELAVDFYELRIADSQQKLLNDTVAQYQDALRITTNRYNGGVAVKSDVTQAQTQLQTARVQAADVAVLRARYEHAIAALVGKAPADFSVPFSPLPADVVPPAIPPGLPSQLLERRPDIASAERRAAEGNQAVGIAQAAFYPSVLLGASLGYQSTAAVQSLFSPASVVYALGPGLAYTFFDAGRRRGVKQEAIAVFDRDSANYKQTVLTAFQQVEDNLVTLRVLQDEAEQQRAATAAAQESQRIFNNRYVGGVDTYLQVITAQTTALNNERNDLDILRRRMDATVTLVRVLGGGWDRSQLPPQ